MSARFGLPGFSQQLFSLGTMRECFCFLSQSGRFFGQSYFQRFGLLDAASEHGVLHQRGSYR